MAIGIAQIILLGRYCFNTLDPQMRDVGGDLRLIALIVILLRAGFEISREALAKVGVRALLMSFVPCLCEVAAVTGFAPAILGITALEAAMLGVVSLAVVAAKESNPQK